MWNFNNKNKFGLFVLLIVIDLVCITGFFVYFLSLGTHRIWTSLFLALFHAGLLLYFLYYHRGKKLTGSVKRFISFIGIVFFLMIFICLTVFFTAKGKMSEEEKVCDYLNTIRNDKSALTGFFRDMPKGGDLHHHFTGSLFAETYWDALVERDGWINLNTFEIDTPGVKKGVGWKTCKQLLASKQLPYYRQKVIQQWSVKDYHPTLSPSDKHFFDAFEKFRPMSNLLLEPGLKEIKERALSENVSYIETMLSSVDTAIVLSDESKWVSFFRTASPKAGKPEFKDSLNILYQAYKKRNIEQAAITFCGKVESIHKSLQLDDSVFTIRFLTYGNRVAEPLPVFRRLLLAFEAANRSDLIVGVNFVSPEDNNVSMRDYSLHMRIFEFFRTKYPNVKISLHAGELAPGLVKPELLKSHIKEAVVIAQANRIGHGVDIAREEEFVSTLKSMKENSIAVEVNLVSNEFILKVKDDDHPLVLYQQYGVPIVLSTDDAGILRTDLTSQFILAAFRYPSLNYRDLKAFVLNSIKYSFIKDAKLREQKLRALDIAFAIFEKRICDRIKAEH